MSTLPTFVIGLLLIIAGLLIVLLRSNKQKKGFKGSIQADISVFGVGIALLIVGVIYILKGL
jgi:hypothetical protein